MNCERADLLMGLLSEDGDVVSFSYQIAPDGQKAMYIADQDENDVFELYLTPVGPSLRATKANGAHARPGGAVVR